MSLAIASVTHGWGKPVAYFTPENLKETLRLQFALQTVWIITYCLVRLSVACSLLRYGVDRSWRWPLYFIMGLQVSISSSYVVIQFAQCTPISSNWDMVPGAKCWNMAPIINYGWAIAGMLPTASSWLISNHDRYLYCHRPRALTHANSPDSNAEPQHLRKDTHLRPHGHGSLGHRHRMRKDDNILDFWQR